MTTTDDYCEGDCDFSPRDWSWREYQRQPEHWSGLGTKDEINWTDWFEFIPMDEPPF